MKTTFFSPTTQAEADAIARSKGYYQECHLQLRYLSNELAGELLSFGGRYSHADLVKRTEIIGRIKLAADKMLEADEGKCDWAEARDFIWEHCGRPAWKERENELARQAALKGAIIDIVQTTAPERAAALRPWEV